MSSERAIQDLEPFSTQSRVVLNCGNIASWSKIKKKTVLTTSAELLSTVENTLISYNGSQQAYSCANHMAIVRNTGLTQTITEDERANLTITMKIFPSDWDPAQVTHAIDTSLSELGIKSFDTIILSFPPTPESELTLDKIRILWQVIEEAAKNGKMTVVGTADLDKSRLKQLFDYAKVKPRVNQLNLAHCCTIPEDLAAYCKEVDIKLYTHNDELCVLPLKELQDTLSNTLKMNSDVWKYGWISRYNSVINLRGIVSHKGYMVDLEKVEN